MANKQITADWLIPDIVQAYPATRDVLDRYGLKGCGGPAGPRESVAWFAGLHGAPLEQLLAELNAAAERPQPEAVSFLPGLADTIYRPFFRAGVITVLSLGCLWGAINLFLIGRGRDFSSVDYSWTLAHGHAMVFGFVGFFIMGFACQALPRFKRTELWNPRLAYAALPLMAGGIGLQTVAHLIAPATPYLSLGVVAGLLQIVAVASFALVITQTIRKAHRPEPHDSFVYAALVWFLLSALANPFIFWLFESVSTFEEFLFRVATFNAPYRDIQLLGVAVVLILGVSLRFLPHAYGLRMPSTRWRAFLLWGVNGAIAAGAGAFLARRLTGIHAFMLIQQVATLVLFAAAAGAPRQYRLFGPTPESERDRGLKFIRAAYVWFIIAMAMLVFTPVYNFGVYAPFTGSNVPFSHAFFGAYRHSLTVGFIMMMIVGVSSKVVPTLSGVDPRKAASLWPTFILLNVGNLARVSSQIATDFTPAAYAVMGASGFIEVVGLAWWGYELFRNMRIGVRLEREAQAGASRFEGPFTLTDQSKVADVLERYPETLGVFLRHGFAPLRNPVLRRTMARVVTIEQACRREGVSRAALLDDLRREICVENNDVTAS